MLGCVLSADRFASGYGRVQVEGRSRRAHIVAWEERHGPVPKGLELDHKCGNVACRNVDHLEPVTHATNCRRGRQTKLTEGLAAEIRGLLAAGWRQIDIAAAYGVHQTLVSLIKLGKAWAPA